MSKPWTCPCGQVVLSYKGGHCPKSAGPNLPSLGPLNPDLRPSKGIQYPDPLGHPQTHYGMHQTAGSFPLAILPTAICTPL